MRKKDYQKPTMKVVMLQHRMRLLAGSVSATRSDYGIATEEKWE